MTDEKFVQPRPGLTVTGPDGRALSSDGERVTWSSWWARRLRDGDIEIGAAPKGKGDAK